MPVKTKADIYKALGDITRLRIMSLLAKGELCVCEIESILDLSQTNVSRHLSKLSNAEMVTCEKKSQWCYYRIDDKFLKSDNYLVNHIKKGIASDKILLKDQERLKKYRKSGLTCDELKSKKTKLFKSI